MTTIREPKQDRSRATRQRLLEATIECLAELGWTATTVAVVAERAGVSRGAAQHHFPTREDLVLAALEVMFDSRIFTAIGQVDGPPSTEAVITGLLESFASPFFKAALQVWTNAAADPVLRERIVPLEAKFGRVTHRATVRALGVDDRDPQARHLVQITLDLARGLGLADVLTDDSVRRRAIAKQWSATLATALGLPD
ncbi:TetR/AcrR family transcriptional regulator [Mycobacterium talmoniae]|uniref:TetR/AcrR family transcriptional regulator n=1 Tax=Mycobacterium talmoniae TaxID=1858794 RepID=UPI000B2A7409|nr:MULTISPECIES: TetR/AcrR family transcriptional regulator [Mycobacterium]